MRKAITLALATAISAGGLGLIATSASGSVTVPDGRECTKNEYQRVERGMTKVKVDRIIGGKAIPNSGDENSTSYLYGGLMYGDVGAAGCFVVFKNGEHKVVVAKDGWMPRY